MNSKLRREALLSILHSRTAAQPINATALAEHFGVSRQVIVGDIALLRSGGEAIVATSRGYYCPGEVSEGLIRHLVCSHSGQEMETELNAIVDQGGKVRNVAVEHPIYGILTGQLELDCRYEVKCFCEQIQAGNGKPLSALTEGIHTHEISIPDEESYERLCSFLREKGILLACD